jgi:hypothetical protein
MGRGRTMWRCGDNPAASTTVWVMRRLQLTGRRWVYRNPSRSIDRRTCLAELETILDSYEKRISAERLDEHVAAASLFDELTGPVTAKWDPDLGRLRLRRSGTVWDFATRHPDAAQLVAMSGLESTVYHVKVLVDGRLLLVATSDSWTMFVPAVAVYAH